MLETLARPTQTQSLVQLKQSTYGATISLFTLFVFYDAFLYHITHVYKTKTANRYLKICLVRLHLRKQQSQLTVVWTQSNNNNNNNIPNTSEGPLEFRIRHKSTHWRVECVWIYSRFSHICTNFHQNNKPKTRTLASEPRDATGFSHWCNPRI